jgi:hypothetical protein
MTANVTFWVTNILLFVTACSMARLQFIGSDRCPHVGDFMGGFLNDLPFCYTAPPTIAALAYLRVMDTRKRLDVAERRELYETLA